MGKLVLKKRILSLNNTWVVSAMGWDQLEQKKVLKHLQEDQLLLRNHIIPKLGEKKVAHLSQRDVKSFHASLQDTPYQANRVLALLSKMMSLPLAWGWRSDHPIKGIPRFSEEKRDRWLDKEELARLWGVLDSYG